MRKKIQKMMKSDVTLNVPKITIALLQMTYMVLHFQKRMISQQEDVRSGVLKN